MSSTLKIAISLRPELVRQVDEAARRGKVSRSRFIREVLEEALRREQEEEVGRRIDEVFVDAGAAEEQRRTAELFLAAGSAPGEEDAW